MYQKIIESLDKALRKYVVALCGSLIWQSRRANDRLAGRVKEIGNVG